MLRTAARGAVLIGLAVVLGIVLLQVVDEGSGGPGGTTSATTPNGNATTTTGSGIRPPEQVRVVVLNGSGTAGAAGLEENKLRGLGYVIASPAGNAPSRTGSAVQCKGGFESEAVTIAATVTAGATIEAFPAALPPGVSDTDCIIVIGK